jgi:hypothetical protein
MFMEDYEDLLRSLGCSALLAYTTDGLQYEDVVWFSPTEMAAAADRLADLIATNAPEVAAVVAEYQNLYRQDGSSHADQLISDLRVVRLQAQFLAGIGKNRVAFDLQV